MNLTFDDYVKMLGIETLSQEDQVAALSAYAKVVHSQFLLDVFEKVGPDTFNAIKTSIKLGAPLYTTTLKHLVPDYLTIYEASKQKVLSKMHPAPSEKTATDTLPQ